MKFSQNQQEEGKDLVHTLIAKAWESATFKEQLINNPEATIEELVGADMSIPEGKTIVVDDQSDSDTIYINIPANVSVDDFELSEEQLEKVSGGAVCGGLCVLAAVVAGAQIIDWFGQGWNSVE